MTKRTRGGEKKKSLLEIAKSHRRGRRIDIGKEEIELAVAWAKGDISSVAVEKALGLRGSGIYSRLALALAEFMRKNNK